MENLKIEEDIIDGVMYYFVGKKRFNSKKEAEKYIEQIEEEYRAIEMRKLGEEQNIIDDYK